MKFKAIIEKRTGERIILDLNCREYHAQKLQYVFSRTLDRSIYNDAHVVALDFVPAEIKPAKRTRKIKSERLQITGGQDENKKT